MESMTTMTVPQALDIARYSLILVIQLAGPVLIVGMLIGLAISLLQAVTQIQEQTLTFVPKMIAMAIAAIIFLPWLLTKMLSFTQAMFSLGGG